ncbi:hypothetical protein F4824DRAFT_104185 [Ustulina deusta]|nr:hypothetical protein F4824DRAFT_104185 [Ustulina deusta]
MLHNKKAVLSAAALAGVSLAQDGSARTTAGGHAADCTQSYARLLAEAPTPTGELALAITSWALGAEQSAPAGGSGNGNGNEAANPLSLVAEACAFSAQLAPSLRGEFDAYATRVIGYVSASSSDIDALITDCVATGGAGASYTSFVDALATHTGPLCQATGGAGGGATNGTTSTASPTTTATTTTAGGGGGGGGTATTATTNGQGGGTATTEGGTATSVHTGAAALPTAVLGGAAAAAGLLGAAILL